MPIRHQLCRNAISQPALFADLKHQPTAEIAAADDVVEHQRGVPVGIVSLEANLAEGDDALRHRPAVYDQRAVVTRLSLGQAAAGISDPHQPKPPTHNPPPLSPPHLPPP